MCVCVCVCVVVVAGVVGVVVVVDVAGGVVGVVVVVVVGVVVVVAAGRCCGGLGFLLVFWSVRLVAFRRFVGRLVGWCCVAGRVIFRVGCALTRGLR